MSLVMVFPQPLQIVSGSSVQISFFWVQKAQIISSGDGFFISLLPGQLSFMLLFYQMGLIFQYDTNHMPAVIGNYPHLLNNSCSTPKLSSIFPTIKSTMASRSRGLW